MNSCRTTEKTTTILACYYLDTIASDRKLKKELEQTKKKLDLSEKELKLCNEGMEMSRKMCRARDNLISKLLEDHDYATLQGQEIM